MQRLSLIATAGLILFGFGCARATPPPVAGPAPEVRQARPAANAETPEAPPVATDPAASAPAAIAFATYTGPWFNIEYPESFTMRPGRAGCFTTGRCDSAFFASNDSAIEFYVFSPQWGGDPATDLDLKPATERLVDQKTATVGDVTTTWVTVAAKDRSYTRSYVVIRDENEGSWLLHAFGIKYKDQATYVAWRDVYLTFKGSLVQFTD